MNWLKQLFSHKKLYDKVDEGVSFHLAKRVEELLATGISMVEATALARRECGNVVSIKQTAREAWGWSWLEDLMVDLRYGIRMLGKNPVLTIAAVLKEFLLTESKTLQFRADFFNALNHASRSNPVSDISSATLDPNTGTIVHPGNFGRILGTDSSPRILQFSLRFSF